MSDDIKASMRRFYQEVVNKGRLEVIDELASPSFVEHETGAGFSPDIEGVKQFFGAWRAAVPDLTANVEDLIAEGDRGVARVTFSGTQTGELLGIPPTGKQFRIETIDIVRFEDGLAAEHWGVTDVASLMQQLGVLEPATVGSA